MKLTLMPNDVIAGVTKLDFVIFSNLLLLKKSFSPLIYLFQYFFSFALWVAGSY